MLEHIHPGERIIPADESSLQSILAELLAEQRKTNELLTSLVEASQYSAQEARQIADTLDEIREQKVTVL